MAPRSRHLAAFLSAAALVGLAVAACGGRDAGNATTPGGADAEAAT